MSSEYEIAKDAMIRWQGYARESRTALISHFLTYSAAIIALQTSYVIADTTKVINWPNTFLCGGFFAVLSLMLGSVIVVIRLYDARFTARVASYKHNGKSQKEIDSLRDCADALGGWANNLIPYQIGFFVISAIIFCAWVIGAHILKFYPVH